MAANEEIGAVRTTLEILAILQQRNGERVTEVATAVGIANSSAHRHLSTLEKNGYVVKRGDEYHLSGRFLHLGETVRRRRPEFQLVEQMVSELAEQTGEVVQFVIAEHGHGLVLFRELGDRAVTTDLSRGEPKPLHQSAAGKAILAFLTDDRREKAIEDSGLVSATENTITDRDALDAELAEIREQGVSFNNEERIRGLRAVGVPVRSSHQEVLGSISIAGPKNRIRGETFHEELPSLLRGNVNELEINMAYADGR